MSRSKDHGARLPRALRVIDGIFFFLGAVATAWMAYLTIHQIVVGGVRDLWLIIVLWVLVAYLLLPRVQTILAHIYVPDYFIGRTRVHEGLLGDPVNIALNGTAKQLQTAMVAAGWQQADELGLRSGLRIVASTLSRRPYPTAPVSSLYLFNRMQDFAFEQEVAGNPAQRHHVRFWATAKGWLLPGGTPVDWVAAGTFDRKVGLSDFTLQVTHKVANDTDIERDHVVQSLLDARVGASRSVIEHFSSGYHSRNGGGDAIETDGNLPIVDLTSVKAKRAAAKSRAARGANTPAAVARALLTAARDTAASNQSKRPLALYTGGALMVLRLATAVLVVVTDLAAVPASWDWVVIVIVALVGLLYLLLALRTFLGLPVARVIAMVLSVAAIAAGLVTGHAAGEFAKVVWALGLGLDVGILFTLSGDGVRDYHLRQLAGRRSSRAA